MGVASPGVDTGKRVLVVGAGPSGLSVAYHLRQLGHQVHLVDASEKLGGMMRYGIPAYRLLATCWTPRSTASSISAWTCDSTTPCTTSNASDARRLRRRVPRRRRQLARRVASLGDSARILDAVSYLHQVADDNVPCSGAESWSTAAVTRRWMRHAPLVVWMRPTRSLSIAEAANRCRHDVELEERSKRALRALARPSATSRVTT